MARTTEKEMAALREQDVLRKQMLKEAPAQYADIEEYRQEHLKVGLVFQKEPGGDTVVIRHINWEAPIQQSFPGNANDEIFPPDFPAIPPDPKKRGGLWDAKKKIPKVGGFKSAFTCESPMGYHHFDPETSMHHVKWYREVEEQVQYETRKRGFKSPNLKAQTLPLEKFLALIKGWQVVAQE